MVDGPIEHAKVHLQLIDVVCWRLVVAAAPLATHTVPLADIRFTVEDGGILDVDAGVGFSLKDLPALSTSSALSFHDAYPRVLTAERAPVHLTLVWDLKMASYTSTMYTSKLAATGCSRATEAAIVRAENLIVIFGKILGQRRQSDRKSEDVESSCAG